MKEFIVVCCDKTTKKPIEVLIRSKGKDFSFQEQMVITDRLTEMFESD